jgi:tetratricopeptide (TPR) repeat protein
MNAPSTLALVSNRYRIVDQIGSGSMGMVYRAVDRLSGDAVALKWVTVPGKELQFASQATIFDFRLALAQEFKTLASLRHPHIISVLDYGFVRDPDQEGGRPHPFFTMTLLDGARTILEAGQGQSQETQIDLLIQVLQALAYLHRHGILHRDLKPANVLVTAGALKEAWGQAKVLDFGLSAALEQARGTVGTLAYMAPEVLDQEPVSRASDLYAVGVMAYQLLLGRYPFDRRSTVRLAASILSADPDLSMLENQQLAAVLARWLAKDPAHRCDDAEQVIAELSAATGQPPLQESPAIRESFLAAAQFVGRDDEMGQLTAALDLAARGQGSAWLVGGESGVGKSRLLDELRTQALVAGAMVLRGQAVEAGGQIYQLWREPLRRMALVVELGDLEAGVLKPLIPDLDSLLERNIPDAPELEGEAARQRLYLTIAAVCRAAAQMALPLVLLLEDLHWASRAGGESVEPLKAVMRLIHDLPLLVIASYRDDEHPNLPGEVPGAQNLALRRLDAERIRQLSISMLGDQGAQRQVLDLLHKETEGNAFFLVETVRALAEEAGRLGLVGQRPLPETVFAGGVQQIVRRRLERMPGPDRPLLTLAAVAGRELDLNLLRALSPATGLEKWLADGANVAVLEVQEGTWRFAHGKLREALLAGLSGAESPGLHRQVAEAYEAVYPGGEGHAAALARHWYEAGAHSKAAGYARLAGTQAAAQFANDEAVRFFSLALEWVPESNQEEQIALLLAREKVYHLLGNREAQARDLASLQAAAEALGDEARLAEACLRRAFYDEAISDYESTLAAAQQAVAHARQVEDKTLEAQGYLVWSTALSRLGKYPQAHSQAEQALALARSAGLPKLEADSLRNLGTVSALMDEYETARAYHEQALALVQGMDDLSAQGLALYSLGSLFVVQGLFQEAQPYLEQALVAFRQIGDRRREGMVLNNLGILVTSQGDHAAARTYYEQDLAICREIGDRRGEGMAGGNLGLALYRLGEYEPALVYLEQDLAIARAIGEPQSESVALSNLGRIAQELGDYEQSRAYYARSVDICRRINDRDGEGYELTGLGDALLGLDKFEEATEAFQRAVDLRREMGQPHLMIESVAGLARVALAQGDDAQALDHVARILEYLDGGGSLDGTDQPLRTYLTCYQGLRAGGAARAGEILETAHDLLQEQTAKIPDPETRRSFLESVPYHREIVAAWQAR